MLAALMNERVQAIRRRVVREVLETADAPAARPDAPVLKVNRRDRRPEQLERLIHHIEGQVWDQPDPRRSNEGVVEAGPQLVLGLGVVLELIGIALEHKAK